jgi:hypothetical protein
MKACLFDESVASLLSSILDNSSPNIGLETGSSSHSLAIGKCGTPDDVIRAISLAKKYSMRPYVYFIYGLPGETPESVAASVEVMRAVHQAGAERIILYGFRPLPGSAFSDFPSPDPNDPISAPLRKEADRINRDRKEDYMGQVVRGVAAEPSWTKTGYTMVNPLGEGPLMTVQGGFSPGTLIDLRIVRVLSPGLLEGEVVRK